jgi:energy-converting hydrogenase Eha subunit A
MGEGILMDESTPSLDENKPSRHSWYTVATNSVMDEKTTRLEENDASLNGYMPPTWYNIMYWILILVELLIIVATFISVPILVDQHPPSNWWCDSRYGVLFADYGMPLAIWRFLLTVDEIYFSYLRRNNPAYVGDGGRGFRLVADYFLLWMILIFPKHGQERCIQWLRSKG